MALAAEREEEYGSTYYIYVLFKLNFKTYKLSTLEAGVYSTRMELFLLIT